MSLYHKFSLFRFQPLHLASQYGETVSELVLISLEAQGKEAQTELEEFVVVCSVKHRILDVTHQVLKERPNHDVNDLANLYVNAVFQVGSGMELFEFDTTGNVFLSA